MIAAGLAALASPAAAQSGRTATLPRQEARPAPQQPGHPLLRDGSIIVGSGDGYRLAVRSCAAYFAGADRAPQGGAASPPPGANGLPAAPGMSRVPDVQPPPGASAPRAGTSTPSSPGSSLRPLHSGWRTAGTIYFYDNVCYVRDRLGQVQLIRL